VNKTLLVLFKIYEEALNKNTCKFRIMKKPILHGYREDFLSWIIELSEALPKEQVEENLDWANKIIDLTREGGIMVANGKRFINSLKS